MTRAFVTTILTVSDFLIRLCIGELLCSLCMLYSDKNRQRQQCPIGKESRTWSE